LEIYLDTTLCLYNFKLIYLWIHTHTHTHIDDWKIPKIFQTQIYQKSKYDIFKTDFTIKIEERDIQLTKHFETIQLLSQKSLQKHLARNYKYIHVGLVQVGIKPLTKKGKNTFILAVLRDARFQNFQDSLLSSIEFSLCSDLVSFDCYPNITISLKAYIYIYI